MLDTLESRVTAVVGELLAARTHIAVLSAAAPMPALGPGDAVVRVGVTELQPRTGFGRDSLRLDSGPPPQSQRVLSLAVTVVLSFTLRAPEVGVGQPDLGTARARLLGDLSALGHAMGDARVQDGSIFRPAGGDAGFSMSSFVLQSGDAGTELQGDLLTAEWHYAADAQLWPLGAAVEDGLIDAVDVLVAGLPLRISADRRHLRSGEQTNVRISGIKRDRLVAVDANTRAPTLIAANVISDLPIGQRGQLQGGTAGTETGLRLIPSVDGAASFIYAAPAGDPGATRAETVAIHIATPEGGRGVFIGGVTVGLRPGLVP